MSQDAKTAVTARLDAMIACTANIGNCRSAMSWATNPTKSIAMLARNRPCRSMRTSRPGSTPCPASPATSAVRLLAARTAIACMTAAIP